jgi:hypothetical protein
MFWILTVLLLILYIIDTKMNGTTLVTALFHAQSGQKLTQSKHYYTVKPCGRGTMQKPFSSLSTLPLTHVLDSVAAVCASPPSLLCLSLLSSPSLQCLSSLLALQGLTFLTPMDCPPSLQCLSSLNVLPHKQCLSLLTTLPIPPHCSVSSP